MLFFCDISLVVYCTLRVGVNINKGWLQVYQVLTRKMGQGHPKPQTAASPVSAAQPFLWNIEIFNYSIFQNILVTAWEQL